MMMGVHSIFVMSIEGEIEPEARKWLMCTH